MVRIRRNVRFCPRKADIVGAFMSTCPGERMIAWTAFLSALTRPIGNQAIKAAP
jgi:hypothetical protein